MWLWYMVKGIWIIEYYDKTMIFRCINNSSDLYALLPHIVTYIVVILFVLKIENIVLLKIRDILLFIILRVYSVISTKNLNINYFYKKN